MFSRNAPKVNPFYDLGKPPVDETGKPLYGDVFGTSDSIIAAQVQPEEIDQNLWGELESESEDEVRNIFII